MPPVTLYLNNADYELYLKTPKGRRSDIYAEALKAEAGVLDTIDKARKALLEIEEEKAKLSLKSELVSKRLALLEEKQKSAESTKDFLEMKQEGGARWIIHVHGEAFKNIVGREMNASDVEAAEAWRKANKKGYGPWLDSLRKELSQ